MPIKQIDGKITGSISAPASMRGSLSRNGTLGGNISLPDGGEKNYERLSNKPHINGVELIGDKSIEALGVETLTNMEIKTIFDNVFKGGS